VACEAIPDEALRGMPTARTAVVRTTMDPGILATGPNGKLPDVRNFSPEWRVCDDCARAAVEREDEEIEVEDDEDEG
jgi:hypothetical protein